MLFGVYVDGVLKQSISKEGTALECIIDTLAKIEKDYDIKRIIYANSPGSYMGLKVAYVTLKTYSMIKGCELLSVSGFELNNAGPIRASKQKSFVRCLKTPEQNSQPSQQEGDYLISLSDEPPAPFVLPLNLDSLHLSTDTLPVYFTQAV